MKKLILLLLFIPLVSFGQVTFNELMSINSIDQFKRVMIENNYDFFEDYSSILTYRMNPEENNQGLVFSDVDAKFHTDYNVFHFWFSASGDDTYQHIYNAVKEKCKFYKIRTLTYDDIGFHNPMLILDYACYTCPGSSIGKIGFAKYNRYGKRNGQIRNFKE